MLFSIDAMSIPPTPSIGLQLLFHSGILVSLSVSGPQLERVVIDRTLVGKLISDNISDGNYAPVRFRSPAFTVEEEE